VYTHTYAYTCKYIPIRRSKFGSRSRTRSCRAGSGAGSDRPQFRTPPYVIEHQGSESWQRLIYKIYICCYWTYSFLSISNQIKHLAQQRATNYRKHLPRDPQLQNNQNKQIWLNKAHQPFVTLYPPFSNPLRSIANKPL
jgi:hypothetical protein